MDSWVCLFWFLFLFFLSLSVYFTYFCIITRIWCSWRRSNVLRDLREVRQKRDLDRGPSGERWHKPKWELDMSNNFALLCWCRHAWHGTSVSIMEMYVNTDLRDRECTLAGWNNIILPKWRRLRWEVTKVEVKVMRNTTGTGCRPMTCWGLTLRLMIRKAVMVMMRCGDWKNKMQATELRSKHR